MIHCEGGKFHFGRGSGTWKSSEMDQKNGPHFFEKKAWTGDRYGWGRRLLTELEGAHLVREGPCWLGGSQHPPPPKQGFKWTENFVGMPFLRHDGIRVKILPYFNTKKLEKLWSHSDDYSTSCLIKMKAFIWLQYPLLKGRVGTPKFDWRKINWKHGFELRPDPNQTSFSDPGVGGTTAWGVTGDPIK